MVVGKGAGQLESGFARSGDEAVDEVGGGDAGAALHLGAEPLVVVGGQR
jgi:hypothetical protein